MVLTPAKDSIDVAILVEDIKKSLAFYQGTLGLAKIEEVQMPFGTFHRLRHGTSDVKLLDSTTIPRRTRWDCGHNPVADLGRSSRSRSGISAACAVHSKKKVWSFSSRRRKSVRARVSLYSKTPMATSLS